MTSCDYCEREAVGACDWCDAKTCGACAVDVRPGVTYCSPNPATWPGRGCYKPPVAETGSGVLRQKPRFGRRDGVIPERWVYVKQAREHRPRRHVAHMSWDEVRQARAMARSDAVLYTIAAHFSVPRGEIGKLVRRPFKLRAEVPAPFETPADTEDRECWLRDEVNAAHREALKVQLELDWTEAKKENKRREKEARLALPGEVL